MFIKSCLVLFCFLLFVTGGCESKSSGNQSSAPANTPSSASTPSTSATDNSPKPESGDTASEKAEVKSAIDACALLEKSEIASVQGKEIKEAKPGNRNDDQFLISQCFYLAEVYDRSVSLEVTERNPKNPNQNAVQNFWKERFRESKREEDEEEEKEAGKPRLVPGVGDEAYWIGNDKIGVLYALKKNRMVRISLGGPGEVETRLAKSKTLAAKVLMRLK